MSCQRSLRDLLQSGFSGSELKLFMGDHYPDSGGSIDWAGATEVVAGRVVNWLRQRGLVNGELFASLSARRPGRQIDIDAARMACGVGDSASRMTDLDLTSARRALLRAGLIAEGDLHPDLLSTLPPAVLASRIGASVDTTLSSVLTALRAQGDEPLAAFLTSAARLARRGVDAVALERLAARAQGRLGLQRPFEAEPDELASVEALVGSGDLLDYRYLSTGDRAGRSVGHIRVTPYSDDGPGDGEALGTCWVLGPSLIITNHHVIAARAPGVPAPREELLRAQATGAKVYFDYTAEGGLGPASEIEELVRANETLDYAICRLKTVGPAPLAIRRERPRRGTDDRYPAVNIIQHPSGRKKELGIRNNLIARVGHNTVSYFTDTEPGSSGAPVMDDRWAVLAMHFGTLFVRDVTYQGEDVAHLNRGRLMSAILDDLPAQLRDAILGPSPTPV